MPEYFNEKPQEVVTREEMLRMMSEDQGVTKSQTLTSSIQQPVVPGLISKADLTAAPSPATESGISTQKLLVYAGLAFAVLRWWETREMKKSIRELRSTLRK